jgi:hypothetical protein
MVDEINSICPKCTSDGWIGLHNLYPDTITRPGFFYRGQRILARLLDGEVITCTVGGLIDEWETPHYLVFSKGLRYVVPCEDTELYERDADYYFPYDS